MKTTNTRKSPSAPIIPPPVTQQVVLLAVTGMTPAVLTETVWALAHEQPAVIPHRVVVVTTKRGHARLEQELFSPVAQGKHGLWQLLRDQILGPDLKESSLLTLDPIREITAPNPQTGRSEAVEDFRTSKENAAMADFLLEQVRFFVENPEVKLVTSIAGGRKTLGALLYACMSLLGRETDRLTHVLVTEPYDHPELKPRFYFPEQPAQKLTTVEQKTVRASQARIDLGDIPFVPLRNLFEREFVRKPGSFTELVSRCQIKVKEVASRAVNMVIRRLRREISVNGVPVHTSVYQHVLLLFLAESSCAGARLKITKFNNAIEPLAAFANELYGKRNPSDFNDWRAEARLPSNFDDQNLRRCLNELKEKLRAAGQEAEALIPALPSKGRFSLDLPPTAIVVRD